MNKERKLKMMKQKLK